jgi:hypothetical protein
MDLIIRFLDIEKGFRTIEACLASEFCGISGAINAEYVKSMVDLGFIVNGKFLPVWDIFALVSGMHPDSAAKRTFILESIACDLSLIYNLSRGYDE